MGVVSILLFIICPIASLPFIITGFKKDKKHRIIYLCLVAIFFALFSYNYRPGESDDLYRHQVDVIKYENESFNDLIEDVTTQPEQLSIIYKYLISKTGNINLLQFFTAIICYFIILYLLYTYTLKNKRIDKWRVIGIWLFVLSGFHFMVITSGIFYTLALEIFSLAVYLDYYYNKKKMSLILYVIPVLIHTCSVLPLTLVIIFKLMGSKINYKNITILLVSILSINFLMTTIAPNINNPVVTELSKLYTSYFNNEEHWAYLHTPIVLILYLSRLIPVVIGRFVVVKNNEEVSNFSIFITLLVITLFFQTTFSIRYIHIAVLCGLPILFQAVKHERFGKIFSLSLYMIALPHLVYQIRQLSYAAGVIKNIQNIPFTNVIIQLFGEV